LREHAAAEVEAPELDVERRRQVALDERQVRPRPDADLEDADRLAVVARPLVNWRSGMSQWESGSWSGARWS
jgi:hypothetical protein